MKLSDYEPLKNAMFLFKGDSGTGKSTAIGSFPEPIYIASCDGRIAPLKYNPLIKGRDIEFDMFVAYSPLVAKLEALQDSCPYRTVAVDPLTAFARLSIEHLFENRGLNISKNKDTEPRAVGGIPVMGINEYSGESNAIFSMLMSLAIIRNHGANVILTSHVITTEHETLGGGTRTSRRLLTGGNKIAAEIPTYFDEIYHFYNTKGGLSEESDFRVVTQSNDMDMARTAFYNLPKEIHFTGDLFYQKLIEAVRSISMPESDHEALKTNSY